MNDDVSSWSSTANEASISAYLVFFSALLALVLILSRLLHDHAILASVLPEAGMILLVGMIAGYFVHLFLDEEEANYDYNTNEYINSYSNNYYYDDDGHRDDDAGNGDNSNGDDGNGSDVVDYTDVAENLLSFSPNVFFVALLPPIIFNSGYHLRKELFFRHIGPIVLLAVFGTTISAISIAGILYGVIEYLPFGGAWTGNFHPTFAELLTFGALISATDPVSTLAVFQTKRVDPQLFYLVFGESVLNDAVGLILFQTFAKFVQKNYDNNKKNYDNDSIITNGLWDFCTDFLLNSVISPCLGIFFGIGAAYLLKKIDMRKYRLLELSLYLLIMYVPFLLAEVLQLSGIVTILFTGISAKYYVVPNLSKATQLNSDVLFRLAAHLAETSIFLELGLSVFGLDNKQMFQSLWKFILLSIISCFIGRALNVYPLVAIFNFSLRRRTYNISNNKNGNTNHGDNIDGIATNGTTGVGEQGKMDFSGSKENDNNDNNNDNNNNQQHIHRQNPLASGNIELTRRLTDEHHHVISDMETIMRPKIIQYSSSTCSDSTVTHTKKRDLKIHKNTAHVLWFSGLRGAVAYACVRSFPNTYNHQKQFILITMTIILVTVFFMGGVTEIALNYFSIPMNIDEDDYMDNWHAERNRKNNTKYQQNKCESHSFADCIAHFDEYYIQRFVIRGYGSSLSSTTTTAGTITASDSKQNGSGIVPETVSTTPTAATPTKAALPRIQAIGEAISPGLVVTTPPPTRATAVNSNAMQFRPFHHHLHHYHHHDSQHHISNVEMTPESHYDVMQEMGDDSERNFNSPGSIVLKESLFDYGANC